MGGLFSNIVRVMKTYNVEARAHKAISDGRKVVPPKHPSSIPFIDKMTKEHSDKYQELIEKNESLDKNLRNIFVKSVNNPEEIFPKKEHLPKRTRYESPFEYGYSDPEAIPPGRVTLTLIVKILTEHQSDPKVNNVESLATKYNLETNYLNSVFKYYKLFRLHSSNDKAKQIVGEAWTKNIDVGLRNIKQLPSGKTNSEKKE